MGKTLPAETDRPPGIDTAGGRSRTIAGMAQSSRLCLICGAVFSGDAERTEHMAATHPGERVAWHDHNPYHVAADGTESRIGASALKRMRAAARRASGLPTAKRHGKAAPRRAPVTISPPSPSPVVERPLPDAPDAPPYFVQHHPDRFAATGAAVGPAPDATGEAPAIEPAGPSREQLRIELGAPMLAEIIRNLSVVLSEWDGAGPAGHFSAIEAGQLAMLLHEPTLDVVERYFAGNVNRFRLGMAALIILLGKGRIHAKAIAARRREATDAGAVEVSAEALAAQAAYRGPVAVEAPDDGPADPIAELAARQHAARVRVQ